MQKLMEITKPLKSKVLCLFKYDRQTDGQNNTCNKCAYVKEITTKDVSCLSSKVAEKITFSP